MLNHKTTKPEPFNMPGAGFSGLSEIYEWIDKNTSDINGFLSEIWSKGVYSLSKGTVVKQKKLLPNNSLIHNVRIKSFTEMSGLERPFIISLWISRMIALFSSLVKTSDSFSFWLRGTEGDVVLGFSANNSDVKLINDSILSLFGVSELQQLSEEDLDNWVSLPYEVFIEGLPDADGQDYSYTHFLPLEMFLDTFHSSSLQSETCNWMYSVDIENVPKHEIDMLKKNAEEQISILKRLSSLNISKDNGAGQQEINISFGAVPSVAETCLKYVNAINEVIRDALEFGGWNIKCKFSTDTETAALRGASVIAANISSSNESPSGIRISEDFKCPIFVDSIRLSKYFHFPSIEIPGVSIVPFSRFGYNFRSNDSTCEDNLNIGKILFNRNSIDKDAGIKLSDMTRHLFVTGQTGSGKSNTTRHILKQLWNEKWKVPFLVIEPAKSEYWCLYNDENIKPYFLWSVAGDNLSGIPLKINPFEVMSGVPVQTHIDYLRTAFLASFNLVAPMPFILDIALIRLYEKCGWNLKTGKKNKSNMVPSLKNLQEQIKKVVKDMGYTDRISGDIIAALDARIEGLKIGNRGNIFDCEKSTPAMEVIMNFPFVIDLHLIADDEQKAFVMAILLLRIYEYLEFVAPNHVTERKIRHVTIIEEAHRLLSKVGESGSVEVSNPRSKAVEFFTNMLAEVRSYGESFIICDQIPTKLDPAVLKNTAAKIVHRLVSDDDREAVGKTMNLNQDQISQIGTLHADKGEAIYFGVNTDKAVMTSIPEDKIISGNKSELSKVMKMRTKNLAPFLSLKIDNIDKELRKISDHMQKLESENRDVFEKNEFVIKLHDFYKDFYKNHLD